MQFEVQRGARGMKEDRSAAPAGMMGISLRGCARQLDATSASGSC